MRRITFRADAQLIAAARARAREERTTLNEQFRIWLMQYARPASRVEEALSIIDRISSYARSGGRRFTRDEMNER